MKRSLYFVPLVLLLVLACGSIPAGVSPTATVPPEPTSTLTLTPMPTATSTPVPTATHNVAATVEAKQTQAASSVLGELDQIIGDSDIPYKEGRLVWEESQPITVGLSGPDGQYVDVDEKLTASNFILKSDVTWSATGIIVCGVILRSEANIEEGKQYQFLYMRLSGLPAWAIEVHEFGWFQNSPTNVKYSSALNQENNALNQVLLVAQEEQFTVYINGVRQGRFYDYSKQRSDGAFAFLGYQDSGTGSCVFENSWIWELK
ncbi:MAG: hypothetical protein HY864_18960 [Chloroflexi bacterium]|nr:hypothetical protein [Chloroflexota bacterium]